MKRQPFKSPRILIDSNQQSRDDISNTTGGSTGGGNTSASSKTGINTDISNARNHEHCIDGIIKNYKNTTVNPNMNKSNLNPLNRNDDCINFDKDHYNDINNNRDNSYTEMLNNKGQVEDPNMQFVTEDTSRAVPHETWEEHTPVDVELHTSSNLNTSTELNTSTTSTTSHVSRKRNRSYANYYESPLKKSKQVLKEDSSSSAHWLSSFPQSSASNSTSYANLVENYSVDVKKSNVLQQQNDSNVTTTYDWNRGNPIIRTLKFGKSKRSGGFEGSGTVQNGTFNGNMIASHTASHQTQHSSDGSYGGVSNDKISRRMSVKSGGHDSIEDESGIESIIDSLNDEESIESEFIEKSDIMQNDDDEFKPVSDEEDDEDDEDDENDIDDLDQDSKEIEEIEPQMKELRHKNVHIQSLDTSNHESEHNALSVPPWEGYEKWDSDEETIEVSHLEMQTILKQILP